MQRNSPTLLSEAENVYYWLSQVIKCHVLNVLSLQVTMIAQLFSLPDLDCYVKSRLSCYLTRPVSLVIQHVSANSPLVGFCLDFFFGGGGGAAVVVVEERGHFPP